MLIINADDWGRSREETDRALECFIQGRVTSVSAMVFMRDSVRAAELAQEHGVDAGLHLNLSEPFSAPAQNGHGTPVHERIVRFHKKSRLAALLYHPSLRQPLAETFQAQWAEFRRLYGRAPSHTDGHQHRHLCANLLFCPVIPAGQRVRRSFSYWPGEKSWWNRTYRCLLNRHLRARYRVTDYFFSLGECLRHGRVGRVAELARSASVELMTHPKQEDEFEYLLSDRFLAELGQVSLSSYLAV